MDWDKIIEWGIVGLSQLWSFVTVAFLVYALGVLSKAIATKKGWRGTEENPSWFDIWMRFAPFPAGFAIGLIPFPCLHAIEQIGDGAWNPPEVAARAGWFMLAGAVCGQVYELATYAVAVVKRRLAALAKP